MELSLPPYRVVKQGFRFPPTISQGTTQHMKMIAPFSVPKKKIPFVLLVSMIAGNSRVYYIAWPDSLEKKTHTFTLRGKVEAPGLARK